MTPAISVIVPVFNAESTIKKLIDSFVCQTLSNWEMICVDDGSTDSTPLILNYYSELDNRIKVLHKTNEGVSAARQMGLDNALGDYVINADADDWAEPTMLEELYEKAQETDTDVVICDYYLNTGNKQSYCEQKPSKCDATTVLNELFIHLYGSCWNKLVKRSCLNRYSIRFPSHINYCEDLLFWCMLFRNPEVSVSYLPKAYYHYVMNESSLTHNMTRLRFKELELYCSKMSEMLSRDQYCDIQWKIRFGIFMEVFPTKGVMSKTEIKKYCNAIMLNNKFFETLCIRWKIGFYLIKYGFINWAYYFIRY